FYFFFSSRRRHTRFKCDWSSDVCSSDLVLGFVIRNPNPLSRPLLLQARLPRKVARRARLGANGVRRQHPAQRELPTCRGLKRTVQTPPEGARLAALRQGI